ncbi:MAG: hypothetical protein JO291_00025 [Acidimicrobiia bacterium]|nr:hypothetical protein [Acidimicrobiia bacterium]
MTTTAPPDHGIAPRTRSIPAVGDLTDRAAGLGAIGFAGLVIVQNVIRGSAPQPGADIDDVVAHYADHRGLTVVLTVTFVLSLGCLAAFLGGVVRRLVTSGRPGWAVLGGAGGMAIIALFASVVAAEQAISVLAAGSAPDPQAIEALWSLHNSLFTVNMLFIGIALVGLSRAGIAAGITPRAFARLAPAGAALLAIGTLSGPYTANGEAMVLFGVSVVGFVVWLAFLVATGVRLVRSDAS